MEFLGSLISAGASMFNQHQTNQMQQQMMQQQQAYQTQMSNTAYQRASTDMQAAGLNPMMMFGSGSAASTPAGASPSPAIKSAVPDGDQIMRSLSTATQMRVADKTIDNLVDQNALLKSQNVTEKERPLLVASQAVKNATGATLDSARSSESTANTNLKKASLPITENEARTSANQLDMNPTIRKTLDQLGYSGRKASDILSPLGEFAWSAKGVRSLFPRRDRHESHMSDTNGGGRSTFSERYTGW